MTRMRCVFLALMFAVAGFGQGPPQDRLGGLTELIERKPDYANAYYARGTIYLQGLLFADAVKDLTKAIELRPDDASALGRRAEAFAGLSQHREAVADLTKAIGLKPSNTNFYLRRAESYSASGQCDLAVGDYSEVIRRSANPTAYRGRAVCRRQLGDAAGAATDEMLSTDATARMRDFQSLERPVIANPVPRILPPTPTPENVFKIGGAVTQPYILFKVEPEYSEEARKAKWQGTVKLSVVVDEFGQAQDIKVVRALGLGLDQEAVEAVSRWVFKPGTMNGTPVAVFATIEVTFHLL
jgi:TonB family protein